MQLKPEEQETLSSASFTEDFKSLAAPFITSQGLRLSYCEMQKWANRGQLEQNCLVGSGCNCPKHGPSSSFDLWFHLSFSEDVDLQTKMQGL